MSRDDGFPIADTSTALPADPKFTALWRRLRDKAGMCEARTIYQDVQLASWAAGERVTALEAASLWLDPDPAILAAMVAVGLLDDEHQIPEHVWASWYLPAYERREETRLKGQIGGLMASLGMTREQAVAEAKRRRANPPKPDSSPAQAEPNPSVPSLPTVRPSALEDGLQEPTTKEDERPQGGNGAESVLAGRVPCPAYMEHQLAHYFADGQWRCRTCETAA